MSESAVDGARTTECVTEFIECGQYGCRKALERVASAMPDVCDELERRGIPACTLPYGEGAPGLDVGLDADLGLAVRIQGPTDGTPGLALYFDRTENRVGRVAGLESRADYEQRRAKQQAWCNALNEKHRKAYLAAHARWKARDQAHRREVAREKEEWARHDLRRSVGTGAKRYFMRVGGNLVGFAGAAAGVVLHRAWDLPEYYRAIREEHHGSSILRLFQLALPWVLIVAPVLLGVWLRMVLRSASEDIEEPYYFEPRGPKEPVKPKHRVVPPEQRFDMLDSLELVRDYTIDTVTKTVRAAVELKIVPESMRR